MSYFNTNGLSRREAAAAERKANSQNEKIYELFRKRPGQKATASMVLKLAVQLEVISDQTPITSVRRALSQLSASNDKRLIKLAETKDSPLGSKEHYFQLNSQNA